MDKKLGYGLMVTVIVLLSLNFAQWVRWTSIESVTARYYELKTERDEETKRLNSIIRQANGTVEVQDDNS